MLALAGGALGVAVAAGAIEAFVAFGPPDIPRLSEMGIDLRALAGDEGVRVEFKRRFASGWETGVWYTVTNGDDITSPSFSSFRRAWRTGPRLVPSSVERVASISRSPGS